MAPTCACSTPTDESVLCKMKKQKGRTSPDGNAGEKDRNDHFGQWRLHTKSPLRNEISSIRHSDDESYGFTRLTCTFGSLYSLPAFFACSCSVEVLHSRSDRLRRHSNTSFALAAYCVASVLVSFSAWRFCFPKLGVRQEWRGS